MSSTPRNPPPRQVPTLTEVVDVNAGRTGPVPMPPLPVLPPIPAPPGPVQVQAPVPVPPPTRPSPTPTALPTVPPPTLLPPPATATLTSARRPVLAMVSEEQLTQRVMLDLQRQIDGLLEQRLRDTLAPALARAADAMVRELHDELVLALRELVAQAIAKELARHKNPGVHS